MDIPSTFANSLIEAVRHCDDGVNGFLSELNRWGVPKAQINAELWMKQGRIYSMEAYKREVQA